MRLRSKEGIALALLIQLAIPIFQKAERAFPRSGPGRKPDFSDWRMALLMMVAIAKRKKSKAAQYLYLKQHREQLSEGLQLQRFPGRSADYDRYRRAHRLLLVAIEKNGAMAARYGWADAEVVAVDKSVIRAQGPVVLR